MEVLIRAAVPGDCSRIRPLQKEIADLHYEGRPDLFKTEARFFTPESFTKRLEDPNHTVLIAESSDGEVVGYAFAWVIAYREHPTYRDFDCFYIDDICVGKKYRRKGIGRRLFEHCKAKAKALGCKNMDLSVWRFNQQAIAFYESSGMTERIRRMELRLED